MRKTLFICFGLILLLLPSCSNEGSNKDKDGNTQDSAAAAVSFEIQQLNDQISKSPENAELYYRRATQYLAEKNYNKSLTDSKLAVEMQPENAIYQYKLGEIAFITNEIALAKQALQEAIRLQPTFVDAYLKLAELQIALRELDPSLTTIENLLDKDQSNARAFFMRGMIWKEKGDTVAAIKNFQKTVALDNDYYDAYAQLGIIFGVRKDKIGIAYLDNALRINDLSTEALYARGLLYQELGKFDLAVADYRKILAINPNYAAALYNIGMINFRMEKFEAAIESFNQAILADDTYADAYYMRGVSHEGKGDYTQAAQNYEACLKLDPNHKRAKENLEYLRKR